MRAASLFRARVRSRDPDESRRTLADVVEREGVSNQGETLPGVGAHDAGASSTETGLVTFFVASRSGSTLWGSSYATGSPPLLHYDLKNLSKSKARLRASMK